MIKIETLEIDGLAPALHGMRNPLNSWDRADSYYTYIENPETGNMAKFEFFMGDNDHELAMKLAKSGSTHAKYRRMIVVYADITAPLYWWKEFDTYKVGTVANSCSTMHKIHSKEFTLEDFSCEHLFTGKEFGDTAEELWSAGAFHVEHNYDPHALDADGIEGWYEAEYAKDILLKTIDALNYYREKFLEAKEVEKRQKEESERAKRVGQVPASSGRYFEIEAKQYWWQMIQLLPSSYNQRRTVMLNYEVLAGIYPKRKDHKLDCWHDFCNWIKTLPYSEIITLEERNVQETL